MTPDRHDTAPSDRTTILRDRARALARRAEHAPTAETQLEVLAFRLGQEHYAVETRYVREVSPLRDLTPLPCTPSFVLGIVNVRGQVLPVFDLKKLFDLPEEGLTDLHRIVVVRWHDIELGLLADLSLGVRSIPLSGLQPSLPTLTGIRGDYLKGVTAERLVVLDLASLLADPRIIVNENVEV